jgi:pimeloyl-ACP methyl ester carboxylesterase
MLGHGGRPIPEALAIEDIAADVIAYFDERGIAKPIVFGYSSGGFVALYLARHFPERVAGVCTLAAKYIFDEKTISHWTYLANPDRLAPRNKRVEELSKSHHPQDWRLVTLAIRKWFVELGRTPPLSEDDFRAIRQPVLVFSSNEDQIVPVEETIALGNLVPNARVVLFKGQSHPFDVVPIDAIGKAICNWIGEVQAGAPVKER